MSNRQIVSIPIPEPSSQFWKERTNILKYYTPLTGYAFSFQCLQHDSKNLPEYWVSTLHAVHSLAPLSENVFLGHNLQEEDPAVSLYVPGLQGKHSDV